MAEFRIDPGGTKIWVALLYLTAVYPGGRNPGRSWWDWSPDGTAYNTLCQYICLYFQLVGSGGTLLLSVLDFALSLSGPGWLNLQVST